MPNTTLRTLIRYLFSVTTALLLRVYWTHLTDEVTKTQRGKWLSQGYIVFLARSQYFLSDGYWWLEDWRKIPSTHLRQTAYSSFNQVDRKGHYAWQTPHLYPLNPGVQATNPKVRMVQMARIRCPAPQSFCRKNIGFAGGQTCAPNVGNNWPPWTLVSTSKRGFIMSSS